MSCLRLLSVFAKTHFHAGLTGAADPHPPAPRASTDRTVAAHASWKWWRPASKTPNWEQLPKNGDRKVGLLGRLFGRGKAGQVPILRRSASDLFDRPSGVNSSMHPWHQLPSCSQRTPAGATVAACSPRTYAATMEPLNERSTVSKSGNVHACAGWAVDEKAKRRGFMEDIRVGCELAVTSVFEAVRVIVRRVLALPSQSAWSPTPRSPRGPSTRRRTRSEDPGVFTEVSALAAMPCNSLAVYHIILGEE